MKKLIATLFLLTVFSITLPAQNSYTIQLETAEYNGSGKEMEQIAYMSNHDYLALAMSASANGVAAIGINLSDPAPQHRTLFVFASGGQIITTTLIDQ